LDPLETAPPNGISIISAILQAHLYDQHTDRQTTLRATSVAIGLIYAVWLNNNYNRTFFTVLSSSTKVLIAVKISNQE